MSVRVFHCCRRPKTSTRGDVTRPGQLGSSGGSGDLVRATTRPECARTGWSLPTQPNSGFPKISVGILPIRGDVFPSFTSVRHPAGDGAHDKSAVGAASWSRSARWQAQPRLVQGRQRESLQMRLVAFLATASRRGGNNDRLSTLWQEVTSLASVARSS